MLDEDATKGKELRIQVELYRVLMNYVVEGPALLDQFGSSWTPDDVFVEASIVDSSGKKKKADLVLMARNVEYGRPVGQPILVIETKPRKLSRLTQYYQSALKQARNYAHSIRCPTYAVFDGHTMILMQIPSPFLIGLYQWSLPRRNNRDREFARKLWNTSINLKKSQATTPVSEFSFHPDFEPWKRSIEFFIRDALQFKIEVDQRMSTQGFNIEEETRRLADIYRSMFS